MDAIRPARIEEAAALREVAQRAYAPWIAVIGRRPRPMDHDYAAHVAAGEAFVIIRDGAIAAYAVLVAAADHLLIDNVGVVPAYQGQGLGRALVAFAEARARDAGYAQARLFTHERMAANIALYTRLGYVETHRAEQEGFPRVFMAKPLA